MTYIHNNIFKGKKIGTKIIKEKIQELGLETINMDLKKLDKNQIHIIK